MNPLRALARRYCAHGEREIIAMERRVDDIERRAERARKLTGRAAVRATRDYERDVLRRRLPK